MYKVTKKKDKEIITLVGENPLTKYKEENGAVRKYSKKGNGPEIISMKYESEKLVTVRYTNVSYHKAKGMYVIDEQWYKQEKANKKIK